MNTHKKEVSTNYPDFEKAGPGTDAIIRILALIKKEFLALLKDKKSRFVIIAPPIVQLLVFGYAATYDLDRVDYAVYSQDKGQYGRRLLSGFSGSANFRFVQAIQNEKTIAGIIDQRKALVVISLDSTFSQNIHSGKQADVQVVIDGRNSNTAMIALNYIREILSDFNRQMIKEKGSALHARLNNRPWFNSNLKSRWFIVPGIMGVLTLLVTMLVTALTVAREREQGTFDRLLVTPLTPFEILAGKSVPGFIIGFFEGFLCFAIVILWFGVPFRGSIFFLVAGLFIFLLSAVGVGLFISSMSVTQQQGLLGAFLFMVPAVILSGFTTPIENMPEIVQKLTLLNPMRYFMVVLRGCFLEDAPVSIFLSQFWPMLLIGLVTLTLACMLFRYRIS